VTTGHPAGFGNPFALHPGGDELNVTPDVIGFRFPFIRVMDGLPWSVQVVSEKFVRLMTPSREPAAPNNRPTARSDADVHSGMVEVGVRGADDAGGDTAGC
jgi:hypothetical protein